MSYGNRNYGQQSFVQQPQQQAYGQPQYQQAPPQQAPVNLEDFSLPSANESQSDFRGWPQNVEGPFNLEIVLVDAPRMKSAQYQKDQNKVQHYHVLKSQGAPESVALRESGVELQVPIKFEVFGVTDPYHDEDGNEVDMNGLTVQEWFNPSMNSDSYMFGLIKAIKHGQVDPSERLGLPFLVSARVIGMVELGKPRMKEGWDRPVRYPGAKKFSAYRGEFVQGSAQERFFAQMRGQTKTTSGFDLPEESRSRGQQAVQQGWAPPSPGVGPGEVEIDDVPF
jgi:hypothetical protein